MMKEMNTKNIFDKNLLCKADKSVFFYQLLYGDYGMKFLCLLQLKESLRYAKKIVCKSNLETTIFTLTDEEIVMYRDLLVYWLKNELYFYNDNDSDLDEDRFLTFAILDVLYFMPTKLLSNNTLKSCINDSSSKWCEIKPRTKAIFTKGFDPVNPEYDGSFSLEKNFQLLLNSLSNR